MEHSEYIREIHGGKTIMLFIHGILGTPNHFRDMILKVPLDYSIFNVLLDGHGGTVDDFANTSMSKWKKQIEMIVSDLSTKYDNIIITAHSMGTLFAIRAAVDNPKVKALFLLAVPLKIFIKPIAIKNSLRVLFNKINENNPEMIATQQAYGIIPDKRLWKYIRWIPNYFSLFKEIKVTRNIIGQLNVPGMIFQSEKDELILCSLKYIESMTQLKCNMLKQSRHYYYAKDDYRHMLHEFEVFCVSLEL